MTVIINFFKSILSSLSYIIPISKEILVFSSFPDYSDNAYAFYKYLYKTERNRPYVFIWLLTDKSTFTVKEDKIIKENPEAKVFYRFSIKGFWYFFRAKYIFCTHGINSFISLKQDNKIVNLWHGIPLKRVGSLDPKNNGFNPAKADYLIANSILTQEIMSNCFNNFNKKKIFITGQPRNDLLFEETNFYKINNIQRTLFRKIGIWLPTFRASNMSKNQVDGLYEVGKISFLGLNELAVLNKALKKNNDLLIIKLHPMDVLQKHSFTEFSNLIIIKEKNFTCQLYPLLGSTDYLLTDYSSVFIDYEISGKPIGFVFNDFEEFKSSRGFTIENLDKKLPGPIIQNINDLIYFINNFESIKVNESKLFNLYKDGNASKRISNLLNL
jgi:CDP-glycerol glycerophosphotransferase (TagB/SpsB family)